MSMVTEDITAHDHRVRRCPMLGHDVPFSYCRAPGREIPCAKIGDCWYETFDVETFVRAHYNEEQVQQILAPPRDKVLSIVELIEKARKAGGSS
ncbi:MAG TPA: hypothetical protein VM031_02770 [Phycisphaerae bacterium]|nr:hypothetical protein [Phycisphaerae bacterium]